MYYFSLFLLLDRSAGGLVESLMIQTKEDNHEVVIFFETGKNN